MKPRATNPEHGFSSDDRAKFHEAISDSSHSMTYGKIVSKEKKLASQKSSEYNKRISKKSKGNSSVPFLNRSINPMPAGSSDPN